MNKFFYLLGIILLFGGCSFKADTKEITKFPEQALDKDVIEYQNYEGNIDYLKSAPEWNKDLEYKVKEFNSFVDSSFISIENHKEYLRKIYKVEYYNFDEKGFNPNNANSGSSADSEKTKSNGAVKTSNTSKIKETPKDEESSAQQINTESKNSNSNKKSMTGYGGQILEEYNF